MSTRTARLRLALAAAIAGVAALRLLISIVPDTIFDVDPLSTGIAYSGIGPAASVVIDAVLLLLVAITLEVERRGAGVDGWLLLLLVIPVGPIMFHSIGSALDLWRGVDWFAAAAAAVALAHLARTSDCRSLALGILVAAIVATGLRGGWQLFSEHPETVAHFEQHREEVLRMNGWTEGSPAALTYERRLRQPEATGWIGFSNITSGFYGAAAVLLFGLAAWSRGREGARGIPIGLAVVAAVLVSFIVLNGSKGAIGATVFGGLLAGAAGLRGGFGGAIRRYAGALVVIALVLVVGAVVGRGALEEGFLGEKSVLFRAHYLEAGLKLIEAEPWLGVGPDGFQDAYSGVRPLRSPEIPASAHSMWLDWVVSLGVAGAAWVGVILVLLLRRPGDKESAGRGVQPSVALVAALVIFCIVLVFQFLVEGPVLGADSLIVRVLGVTLAVTVVVFMAEALRSVPAEAMRVLALCAAAVVLVQSQIEMLFWQPGSVAMAWCLLGVAGTARGGRWKNTALLWPWVLAVTALWQGMRLAFVEAHTRRAAAPLFDLANGQEKATPEEVAQARVEVAQVLRAGMAEDSAWWDERAARAVIIQLALARSESAVDFAEAWSRARPTAGSSSMYASVARSFGSESAIEATRFALEYRPFAPRLHLALAVLLAEAGEPEEAQAELAEAVRLNEALSLDPLAQFTELEQAQVAALAVGGQKVPELPQ